MLLYSHEGSVIFFDFVKSKHKEASEGWEIEFLESDEVKFRKQNWNHWVKTKTVHNSRVNFLTW